MSSIKQAVTELLRQLPDDCSLEDVQYHLYVLTKVRQGLESADTQATLSQVAAEQHLSRWIIP